LFGVWLLPVFCYLSFDIIIADVVLLAQVKELSNFGGSLGSMSSGLDLIRESRDLFRTFLHNDEVQNGQFGGDDTATHRLALAFTLPSRTITRVALGEQ